MISDPSIKLRELPFENPFYLVNREENRLFVFEKDSNTFGAYELPSLKELYKVEKIGDEPIVAMALTPNEEIIAILQEDAHIYFLRTSDGEVVSEFEENLKAPSHIFFVSDSKFIVCY